MLELVFLLEIGSLVVFVLSAVTVTHVRSIHITERSRGLFNCISPIMDEHRDERSG